nr:XRE family transcriptional regulator [uncultured Selenomonas sp.]
MTTWAEYKAEALKDPELKREYDALEGWYQAELARQEALDRKEEEARRASTPPSRPAFA